MSAVSEGIENVHDLLLRALKFAFVSFAPLRSTGEML
jgi:hypothetical protein